MNTFDDHSAELADIIAHLRLDWQQSCEEWQDVVAEQLWSEHLEGAIGGMESLVSEMQEVARTCTDAESEISQSSQK